MIHPVRYCSGSISTRKARSPLLQREIGFYLTGGLQRNAADGFYEIIIKDGIRGRIDGNGFARAQIFILVNPGEALLHSSGFKDKGRNRVAGIPFCLGLDGKATGGEGIRSCLRCSGKYTRQFRRRSSRILSCSPGEPTRLLKVQTIRSCPSGLRQEKDFQVSPAALLEAKPK